MIVRTKEICNGEPYIKNSTIAIPDIISLLFVGETIDNIRREYGLSRDEISDVKRYIDEQQGKDVFEYSIFGDTQSQTKIGDFSI